MISHPLIKENAIDEREYQVKIAKSCLKGNTLVVLPTGLGKTIIAILLMAEVLHRKGGKILFLAPTKPLVEQHARSVKSLMNVNPEDVAVFTGEVKKKNREERWKDAKIIISTPQVIQNDLISGNINLDGVNLVIFDEAHRAVGNYAYVYIAGEYRKKKDHLILAITASPGGKEEKIMEIIENLGIENVEIRTDDDPDVKPYIKEVKIRIIELPMPKEFKELYAKVKSLYEDIIAELRKYGLFLTIKRVSRKDILMEQRAVQDKISEGKSEYYQAAMLLSMAIKIDYSLEYLETQGFDAFYNYLMKIIEEGNSKGGGKAARTLVRHEKFVDIVKTARTLKENIENVENPKLNALGTLLRKKFADNPDLKVIVFTHYRETARIVEEYLKDYESIRAVRFVGQANKGEDKGLNQKQQVEIIKKFREGEYNVLIATSVAEEGLDIPATDMVVFYEPVPSEIRTIQRKGRTGRTNFGEVYILSIKGTRDIAYLWSSRNKEKKMKSEMKWLRRFLSEKISGEQREIFEEEEKREEKRVDVKGQLTLFEFENEVKKEKIHVDTREFRSEVVKILAENFNVVPVQLAVGDYVISDRVAIERKTTTDFLESIRDGRLFEQIKNLKSNYENAVLIIEGESLFSSGFHDNAIYGALASILVDFNVPVIFTKNPRETAKMIQALYNREKKEKREVSLRKEKKAMTMDERQRFIVESLPNVSAKLSQRLLEHFGSVKDVINAEVGELIMVKGIGRKTAEEIHEVVNKKYRKK